MHTSSNSRVYTVISHWHMHRRVIDLSVCVYVHVSVVLH